METHVHVKSTTHQCRSADKKLLFFSLNDFSIILDDVSVWAGSWHGTSGWCHITWKEE